MKSFIFLLFFSIYISSSIVQATPIRDSQNVSAGIALGSISVYLMLFDNEYNMLDSSTISGSIVIPWESFGYSTGAFASPLSDSIFNLPFSLNTDLLGNDGVNDAFCINYADLPIGAYYYGPAIYSFEPGLCSAVYFLYNDQFKTEFNSIRDLFVYGIKSDSNGIIDLSAKGPHRDFVVMGKLEQYPVYTHINKSDIATTKDLEQVPEPATLLMFGSGIAVFYSVFQIRKKARKTVISDQ